ncbi:zinc finger CCCH domain-containing protein 6 [Phtheirospermum japonicum]|uniref:Zinc finger CCCH domain-containing protein 6 n=1 Tax=Phtheirospermum japonicum TaxID=374723 RepID=A0A830CFQ2_9LAMI|nr:zinc finger CCCH domain-containing protein 6 [Phtheirospermum japonicum]
MGSDDNLPPGFEGAQPANPWTARLSQIPLIKWKRPLRFQLNIDWQVVAGEESREIEIQNRREMRVLEAIYPRPSAIPPNPCELANVEDPTNDECTPVVPITPIEDEDAAIDSTSYDTHNTPTPANTNPMIISAQAALTSVTGQANNSNNNNNNNNMIDPGLLIKILSDPKMIEQLMSNRSPHYIPSPRPPQQQINPFVNRRDPLPSHALAPRPMMPPPGPFYPPRNINIHPPLPPHVPDPIPGPGQSLGAPLPVTRDMNYFKSLIQQHGGERRENGPAQFAHPATSSQEHHVNAMMMMKPREMTKPKIMKPCIYFNSPKGCRNGPDCSFQHEIVPSAQQRVGSGIPEVQSTKRAKLDGEITGL